MKKIIYFTLIILGLNFFLLFFPILFFILNLSLTQSQFVDDLFHFYPFLTLLSPVLTVALCIRLMRLHPFKHPWIGLITVSLIGYAPIWVACYFLSLCWSLLDYLWLILFPFLPGLIALGIIRFGPYGKKFIKRAKFT